LCLAVLFTCFLFDRITQKCRDCCRKKKIRVVHVNKITPAAMKALKIMRNNKSLAMQEGRAPSEHLRSIGGAGAVLVLYLYFALLSMAVQVHMCEYLDDNLSVLIAEPSEPCNILYSYQEVKDVSLALYGEAKENFKLTTNFYPVLYPLSVSYVYLLNLFS
jgi:hypothetical protein